MDVVVTGDTHYKIRDGVYKGITKKNMNMLNVAEIKCSGKLNRNKIVDVKKLIETHYGDNWPNDEELVYFKNIIIGHNMEKDASETDPNDNALCECQDDSPDLRI